MATSVELSAPGLRERMRGERLAQEIRRLLDRAAGVSARAFGATKSQIVPR